MTTLKNTPENKATVLALKTIIKENQWSGETIHDTIEKALIAINLFSFNSGWHNSQSIKLKGINGIFMINQDGSLNFESRIIKTDNGKYKIEYLTREGYIDFEAQYNKEIDLIEN